MFAGPLDEARVLISRGDIDPAIYRLSEFLNGQFYHPEALFMLGGCYLAKGLNGLAAVVTSAAVDAYAMKNKPFPEALLNLGVAYRVENDNETAGRIWRDALKHETVPSERAKIMCNIAGLYVHENAALQAIEWCDKAIAEDPKCYKAHAQRGLACLEIGRWREGWEGWRQTYAAGERARKNYGDLPEWDGAPGKHVIVYGDQGIGDEIFYASCLADMQRLCRRVTFDCHPRLTALFKRSFPEITVHGTRKDLNDLPWLRGSDAEAAVAIADLPCFLRNEGEWDGKPYLRAHREENFVDTMRRENGASPLRIGLSWTGGSKKTKMSRRSLSIDQLVPILKARPDAQWFSLQYTPNAAREVCELEERTGIRIAHYPGWVECFDYDRTASFVASLDLVVTVTTAVHDLASALGVPNWVMVPSRPPWRFQSEGKRLPWYNAAELFRQTTDDDWAAPVAAIAERVSTWR